MAASERPFAPDDVFVAQTPEVAVVRSFLAALELLDLDRALPFVAPDISYTNVSLPTVHGREAFARLFRRALPLTSRFQATTHRIAGHGPVVLTERTDTIVVGRLQVSFWVCGRFEVHHGQITVWRDYFDWLDVTRGTVRGLAGILLPGLRR